MQKSYVVFAGLCALLSFSTISLAGPPQWEKLFNGKNLDGFEVHVKEDAEGTFFDVVDGVIRAYPNWKKDQAAPNGMLLTKKSFASYYLRWEYRFDGRMFRGQPNSGALYHVQNTDVWPVCMEFQLKHGNGGFPVYMYSQAKIKLTDGQYDPDGKAETVGNAEKIQSSQGATVADKPVGQWNRGELMVLGTRAYHLVNGQVVARLENLKQPNADKSDWVPLREGRIGFQCEGAGIEFRNIEIMENPNGYIDTPLIPGQSWRVHDVSRPQPPRAVLPPAPRKPVPAPADAVVLLDEDTYQFTNEDWIVEDGVMTVHRQGKRKPQLSKVDFGDGHYHVEWSAPTKISGSGQGRGNSGIFLMNTYEIQVLDCWDNWTYPDGMVGALYGMMPPLFNAVRKPGEWNIYDIFFKAPIFDGEKLVSPAYVTVMLNGVIIQNNESFLGRSTHRENLPYKPHADKLPLALQDHNNPVRFRNIWVRPLGRDLNAR